MRIPNSISDLRQQIRHDLRIQHPDWVELNGECPMCDAYVACLMEELSIAEGTSEAFGGWHIVIQIGWTEKSKYLTVS